DPFLDGKEGPKTLLYSGTERRGKIKQSLFVDYFKFVLTPQIFDSIDTHSMVFIISSMPAQRFSLLLFL
ncbi:hypothetical protein, partial [Yersinia pseudotuberculosis]